MKPHRRIHRREAIARMGAGLGALGLATAMRADASLRPHFAPRAKRVIHLFMNGGPFGPDFFDPKPSLKRYEGQRPKGVELKTERPTGGLLPVPSLCLHLCFHLISLGGNNVLS